MNYTLIIGGNTLRNCRATFVVNGKEVFRLRDRDNDDRLIVDFELRGEDGNIVAKIAKNNVVYSAPGLEVHNLHDRSEVINPTTGEYLARIVEIRLRTVSVTGMFWFDGRLFKITDEAIEDPNGNRVIGADLTDMGKGFTVSPFGFGIG